MSKNYTWTYPTLYVKLNEDNLSQVVTQILWVCDGIDGDSQLRSNLTGMISLGPPDPDNFTSFDDLTYDQIQIWVNGIIDSSSIQDEIGNIIDSKINSDIVAMSPPF